LDTLKLFIVFEKSTVIYSIGILDGRVSSKKERLIFGGYDVDGSWELESEIIKK